MFFIKCPHLFLVGLLENAPYKCDFFVYFITVTLKDRLG